LLISQPLRAFKFLWFNYSQKEQKSHGTFKKLSRICGYKALLSVEMPLRIVEKKTIIYKKQEKIRRARKNRARQA